MAPLDQHEQHQQELALLDQIGLASLKDDFRDSERRAMGGQLVNLIPQIQANAQRAGGHNGAAKQQVPGNDGLPGIRKCP